VGESLAEPAKYFQNNVEQGIALMGFLIRAGVQIVVFSSTCATYGEPKEIPISEKCPPWPKNPYGWSKFCMERLLESCDLRLFTDSKRSGLEACGFRFEKHRSVGVELAATSSKRLFQNSLDQCSVLT
jgi:UDP-glucose 4-epimerase